MWAKLSGVSERPEAVLQEMYRLLQHDAAADLAMTAAVKLLAERSIVDFTPVMVFDESSPDSDDYISGIFDVKRTIDRESIDELQELTLRYSSDE